MELGLKGAFSSVLALGCVASLTSVALVFAGDSDGKNEKAEEEKKEKEKADKLKKTANALSIANSVNSIASRSVSLAEYYGASNNELALAQENLGVVNNALVAQLLKKVNDNIEEKKDKCALEKVADQVTKTVEFIEKDPYKAVVSTVGITGGMKLLDIARKSGYLDDTAVAAVFPDIVKNMNESKMRDVKYAEAMMSLEEKKLVMKEKEASIQEKELDVESKNFDVGAKKRKAEFYKDRPFVRNAEEYSNAAVNVIANVVKAITSIFNPLSGGGKG